MAQNITDDVPAAIRSETRNWKKRGVKPLEAAKYRRMWAQNSRDVAASWAAKGQPETAARVAEAAEAHDAIAAAWEKIAAVEPK